MERCHLRSGEAGAEDSPVAVAGRLTGCRVVAVPVWGICILHQPVDALDVRGMFETLDQQFEETAVLSPQLHWRWKDVSP